MVLFYNGDVRPKRRNGHDNRTSRILAEAYRPPTLENGPALFLLTGLPGVGKSTFARALSSVTGAVVLESDRFRRLLFRKPSFTQRESRALFQGIVSATRELLSQGQAVIVDATNVSERDRLAFYELADASATKVFIVSLEAPLAVVEERLAKRLTLGDGHSHADIAVYHRMRGRVEPIGRQHWQVDTSDPAAIEAALGAIGVAYREAAGKEVPA